MPVLTRISRPILALYALAFCRLVLDHAAETGLLTVTVPAINIASCTWNDFGGRKALCSLGQVVKRCP
jgi:hypothetical protein